MVKHLPATLETQFRSLGRSPGEGNGNPLQYSCLENSMDGGTWTVHRIIKSWTQLSDFTFTFFRREMLRILKDRCRWLICCLFWPGPQKRRNGLSSGSPSLISYQPSWMASPTRWTWVWVSSGNWWWTGKLGVLQSMGSQRVGHDWATELNW